MDGDRAIQGSAADVGPLVDDQLLRTVMRESAVGMALVEPAGRFLSVNRAICAFFGRDEETVLSSTWQDFTHPEDVRVGEDLVADMAQGLIPSFRHRKRFLHPDGSLVWGDVSVSCVRHPDGSLRLNIAQIVDVTIEVFTLDALERSEERFRMLAENAADVVYEAGLDRRVTWISPTVTEVLGWQPEEIRGMHFSDLVHPEDLASVTEHAVRLYRGDRPDYPRESMEVRVRCRDGSYRSMSGRTMILRDPEGAPCGLVSGMHAVDDLVEARNLAEERRVLVEAVLHSMLEPHVVLRAVREDGRIVDFVYVDANDVACAGMGMERSAVIGLHVLTMAPAPVGEEIVAMYAGVVESGEPLVLDDWAYPHQQPGSERRYDIRGVAIGDLLSFAWRDVTDRHRALERLAESEEQYRLLALNSTDVVLHTRDGEIRWASPSLTAVLGWTAEDWVGRQVGEFVHADDRALIASAHAAVSTGERLVTRVRIRDCEGREHWIEAHSGAYLDAAGEQDGAVTSFRVVDVEVAAQQELEHRARFDDLTGLLTRREIVEGVAGRGRHPSRSGDRTGVLFCDIDRFKQINDSFGHEAGDEVLRSTASRVAGCIRAGDLVARIGGDEILVILDGVHGLDDAVAIAEKIRLAAGEPVPVEGGAVEPTVSIGVTLMRAEEDFDSMLARADGAMYAAKEAGRNRVMVTPA